MAELKTEREFTDSSVTNRFPTVSIGMPVYNGEDYIREALDSLLEQSFSDFELIISDNASTDSTSDICQEYVKKDERIRCIRQTHNAGALFNFQFVLNEARGEYFMWAACDDKWDSSWIEKLLHMLEATGTGAAFGQVKPMNKYSQPILHVATGRLFRFQGTRLMRRIRYFLEYEGAGKANLFYSLFRKSVVKDCNLLDYEHDYHVIFDLLNKTEITSVKGVQLYKRIHAESEAEVNNESRGYLLKLARRLVFPVEPQIQNGYFSRSVSFERFLLILTSPLKYMFAYTYHIRYVINNVFSENVR
ncbi:glycosyltransferase family 2 protein [Sulfuriflexus mobilis]|uniref:glycosyltransferase family 2 protein n=1 Tax=Sulfuriflexus mobilis TaxID=1811807 RepID=UPI000F835B78|nr:glycosyltransferase family 2 protein [Sulfuriflexus mobilis]